MPDLENILLSVFFFFILTGIFFWRQYKKKNSPANTQHKYMLDTLNLARSQYEYFTLKRLNPGGKPGVATAILHEVDRNGLQMETGEFIGEDWAGQEVEAFFRARQEQEPIFYAFKSVVKKISSDYGDSRILLALPDHLRVEKKRHFARVEPQKEDIRVIGVWPLQPGKRLPRSTADIGTPITHYKTGMGKDTVSMDNVSASGLALRFSLDKNGKAPASFEAGSQILCLVVFTLDENEGKPVAFWCTGEVMNRRESENGLVVGVEFTNWAVLEQGTTDIHWSHSSPSKGARPIRKWVEQIDRKTDMQSRGAPASKDN